MSKKVLVVDDELDIVNFMERFLIRRGISVTKATSGDAAIEFCQNDAPDCVFMDVQMPGKDGMESLVSIKAMHPALPVIMITGKESEEFRKKAMDNGACDYITKPIDLNELNEKIDKYIIVS